MPLRLKCRTATRLQVDLAGLTPDWCRDRALREIERRTTIVGRQPTPLAEIFDVSGDPGNAEIHFTGEMSHVASIGAGMTSGVIRVEESVGDRAGAGMAGGLLEIEGNAGDRVGCEMRDGRIHVRGNVGDFAGAALPGARRGVTGGEMFIDGAAGNELGRGMRRGLIVVGGATGDSVGLNLIAGTIVVLGRCGPSPGVGMRRGTIALLAPPTEIPLTFRAANRQRPQFMRLLLNYVRQAGVSIPDEISDAEFDSFGGDRLALGRGEILVAAR